MKSQEPQLCLAQSAHSLNEKLGFSQLFCAKGNVSTMLCQNKNCSKTPFICLIKGCECQQNHKKCLKLLSEQFFSEICHKIVPTHQIKKRVDTIINEAIDYISLIREEIEFSLKYLGLNTNQKQLIHLLTEEQFTSISGTKIWKVSQSIYQQKQLSQSYIIKEVNKYWQKNEAKFKKSFDKLKELAQKETQTISFLFGDFQIIQSPTDIDTLSSFFKQQIIKTKLIYSAKKSNYKMKSFKQIIQKRRNILVIVRSQQGKVFGGFLDKNNIRQNFGLGNTMMQVTKDSFVFSLTNKDKFKPVNVSSQYNVNLAQGPNFGGDFLSIYKQAQTRFQNNPMNVNNPPGFGFGGGIQGLGGMGMGFGFGNPNLGDPVDQGFGGLNGEQTEVNEHYCVIFESRSYHNQKYKSNSQSRIKFAGTKQRMFKIKQWQAFQLEFEGNDE